MIALTRLDPLEEDLLRPDECLGFAERRLCRLKVHLLPRLLALHIARDGD